MNLQYKVAKQPKIDTYMNKAFLLSLTLNFRSRIKYHTQPVVSMFGQIMIQNFLLPPKLTLKIINI